MIRRECAVRAIKDGEPHSIKARESGLRAEPQVPIPGLRNGADRILRQPIDRPPDGEAVLRDWNGGIERVEPDRDQCPSPGSRVPHMPLIARRAEEMSPPFRGG